MTKKKALIFYISRHSGHYHAASAIEKGLLATGAATEVSKINALSYTNPILGKLITRHTSGLSRKTRNYGEICTIIPVS